MGDQVIKIIIKLIHLMKQVIASNLNSMSNKINLRNQLLKGSLHLKGQRYCEFLKCSDFIYFTMHLRWLLCPNNDEKGMRNLLKQEKLAAASDRTMGNMHRQHCSTCLGSYILNPPRFLSHEIVVNCSKS